MNCLSLFLCRDYHLIPVEVNRSLQALTSFAKMHEGSAHSRILLVIRKDWQSGRCYLEASKESDLSLWDRVRQFFGSRAFLLANVKQVVERSLNEIRSVSWPQGELDFLERSRTILNKKLFKKYRDYAPRHVIQAFFSEKERRRIGSLQKTPRGGFQNCGASCYLASVFQSLFSSPPFVQYVQERAELSPTAALLKDVFDEMKKGVPIPHETTKAIVTRCLDHGWLSEKPCALHFDQQDSYSFLSFLLSHLIPSDEVRRFYTMKKGSGRPWNDWLLTLTLHRATLPGMSLQSLINGPSFTHKSVSVPPPPFLAITVDGRTRHKGRKDRTPITAPSVLTIPRREAQEVSEQYRLCSVIAFEGETVNGGHYYTYEPLYDEKGALVAWKMYNDQMIRLYQEPQAVQRICQHISQEGYVFFYAHSVS